MYKQAFQLHHPIRFLKDVSSTRKRKCNEVQLKVTNKPRFPSKKWTVKTLFQTDVCPKAGDAILDLGCGTGELSAYLA